MKAVQASLLPNRSVGFAAAGRARWPDFFASAASLVAGIKSISGIKKLTQLGGDFFTATYDNRADAKTPRGNGSRQADAAPPLIALPTAGESGHNIDHG